MSPAEGLYERVLAAGGGALPPVRPPRPSAAVVPWRHGPSGIEVFWLQRGRVLPFMAGWHGFPGGGLSRRDPSLPVAGEPWHPSPGRPTPPSPGLDVAELEPDLVPGLAACALRELYEESGLLLTHGGRPADPAGLRMRLLAREARLDDALSEAGARLDASRLRFAGRWLTPPFSPLRFDNRFFLLEWTEADGEATIAPPESESGEWIRPATALERLTGGDAMAAPPIVHLLRVLAEEGADGSSPRLVDTREADLGPLRRVELRPGVLLFPLATPTLPPATHTNVYLVGTGECVLVDPGSPFEEENARLVAALEAARRTLGRRLSAIVLTHHHPDHVGGAARLAEQLGVPVAAHGATAERVAEDGIRVERLLEDGDRLVLAGEPEMALRVHWTPGHARGHLAIELEGRGDLLGGDLLSAVSTIVIDPPEGDMDDYLASLERLRGRGLRTLFPAHGAPLLDVDVKLAESIEHRLERERQVLAAWRSGPREPAALVPVIYPDIPEAVRPLAERQVVAHLERLERRGALA